MMMPRFLRRLLAAVTVMAALVVAAAALVARFVDVNRFRPQIAARVQEATGRPVVLGRLSLRLLPAPAVAVRPLRVADSATHPGRDALRADGLSIRVGLLALLRGRLVVRSVILEKPTLTLIRDRQGRWNFDDLLARAALAGRAGGTAGGAQFDVAVERAVVRSGRLLVYDDFVTPGARAQADLRPVDAVITGLGGGGDTRMELSIGLGRSILKSTATLAAGSGAPVLKVRADSKGLQAADLARLTPWLGVLSPPGLKLGGSLDMQGEAEVPIDHPERLSFKGRLRLQDLSYQDASMTRPLEKVGGDLSVDGDRAVWDGFTLKTGGSSLLGRIQVEDFRRPRLGFALTSPALDFNEILAIFVAAPAGTKSADPAGAAPATGLLDGMSGQGTLAVGAIRFQNFDLRDVHAGVNLSRGILTLREMTSSFYDGRLRGTAQVSLAGAVPAYAFGLGLEQVDVAPLLAAYDPGLKDLLQGRVTGELDLTAGGVGMDAILGSARGDGSVELSRGVLTSFSVLKQLATLLESAGGKGIGRDQTPFEWLRMTLTVSDGKARTGDLHLHATDLDLEGRGWVGLDATLDLDATARFSEDSTRGMVEKHAGLARLTENGGLVVFFNLSGALAAPAFRLNTREQARQVKETSRQFVKEKAREKLRDRILKHFEEPAPAEPAPAEPAPDDPAPEP